MSGMRDVCTRKKWLKPLWPALVMLIVGLLLLLPDSAPSVCQEEGEVVIGLRYEFEESVAAVYIDIPVTVVGNKVNGEHLYDESDEYGGFQRGKIALRGTLEEDVMMLNVSYFDTWGSTGDDPWEETATWTATLEMPVVDGIAESKEVLVEATITETSARLELDENETESVIVSAIANVFGVIGGVDGTEGEDGDTVPPPPPPPVDLQHEAVHEQPGGITSIGDVPGPDSWPQAATGILLPPVIGVLLGIFSTLFRGGQAPPFPPPPLGPSPVSPDETSFALPREPADVAFMGPSPPFSQGEVQLVRSLEDIMRSQSERAAWAAAHPDLDYYVNLLDDAGTAFTGTVMDGVEKVVQGTRDFAVGTGMAVTTVAHEWWELGEDLVYNDPLGTLKEMVTPEIWGDTARGIWDSVEPGFNPMEELRAIGDGIGDAWKYGTIREDALWAIPSLAIKVLNIEGIYQGIRWFGSKLPPPAKKAVLPEGAGAQGAPGDPALSKLPDGPKTTSSSHSNPWYEYAKGKPLGTKKPTFPEGAAVKEPAVAEGAVPESPPRKPLVGKGKQLDTKGAAAEGKPRITEAEASAAGTNAAPLGEVAEYRLKKMGEMDTVRDFSTKVKNKQNVPETEVREIMADEATKRTFREQASPEAKDVFAQEQRKIYKSTDDAVLEELRSRPEYADAKIDVVEVSTGGKTDAALSSTDRDYMYVVERKVTVMEGGKPVMEGSKPVVKDGHVVYEGGKPVVRTVTESVPAETVKPVYNETFAEQMGFDPSKPCRGYSNAQWESMPLADRQAAFADQCGQTCMGRTHKHYIVEYRDTPQTGELLRDPGMMGDVYYDKFSEHWVKGGAYNQEKALFQLEKTGRVAEKYGVILDEKTKAALNIVADDSMLPAARELAIEELGIRGGAQGLANKLASMLRARK